MRFLNTLTLTLATVMTVSSEKILHCKEKNVMALTFDDGPFQYTEELLDTLKKADIKATFFINGENYWKDLKSSSSKQAVIKRAVKEGHQIASHTWAHKIPKKNEDILKSLTKLDDLVEKAAGVRPKYFRAPQGHCGKECISYIESLGYKIIQWDLDTKDWDYENYKNLTKTEQFAKRVEESKAILDSNWDKKKKNYLVLMHDVYKHTVREIVPYIIKNAPKKYKFVTVAECLGDKDGAYGPKTVTANFINGNDTQIPPQSQPNNTIPFESNTSQVDVNNLQSNGAMTNTYSAFAIASVFLYTLYMLF